MAIYHNVVERDLESGVASGLDLVESGMCKAALQRPGLQKSFVGPSHRICPTIDTIGKSSKLSPKAKEI